MGFRIQPKDIEIPEEDPFRNDLLIRQEPAEILTQMLGSIEGPCVLAVDAPWGAGKTTFLKMLAQHVRNQEFPVVQFNAWKTDFTSDPFLALSEELTSGVREYAVGPLRDEIKKVKAAAKEVVRLAVPSMPSMIRLATAGLLDISPLIEKEAGQALASIAKKRLSEYLDTRKSLQTFRASLGEFVASDLSFRRIAQSIFRLGLVFLSLRKDRRSLAQAATVALVMRTLDPELYWDFAQGQTEDRKAIQFMLGRSPGLASNHGEFLEAIIIVAAAEIRHPDRYFAHVEPSTLLAGYREAAENAKEAGDNDDVAARRAAAILQWIEHIRADQLRGRGGLGFPEAVRRIELLSSSLLGDDDERSDDGRSN